MTREDAIGWLEYLSDDARSKANTIMPTSIEIAYGMAIDALKAQEPRVIPFNEIDNHEVLWMEVLNVETEDGLAPWVKTRSGRWFSPLLCSDARPDMILSTPEEYGRICRCWTARPTDDQRNAEPWDKEGNKC